MSTASLQRASSASDASSTPAPAIVVFGLDDTGKPHASAFGASEVTLAKKAAGMMGMNILVITTDAERALASRVPKGRLFASGKGFVPFVKTGLYAELQALGPQLGVVATKPAATTLPKASDGASATTTTSETTMPDPSPQTGDGDSADDPLQPTHWADIRVGAIVLAAAAPKHTEWYECQVIGTDKSDGFTLRFCDWPKEPPFVRQRHEMGLMHPSREPEPPMETDEPAA